MFFLIKFTLILIFLFQLAEAQISALFGNAIQAENCAEWTSWGPCIWLKGKNPRWNRPYFDQLLPGRTGCRQHVFFKLLQNRWGQAFKNFYTYLRDVTLNDEQCGQCSYQQSCGRQCHRRGNIESLNPLFVAERRCSDVDQGHACVLKQINNNCLLWPNPTITLPNVTTSMLEIVNKFEYLSCLPDKGDTEESICRCCCHPFRPNPNNNFRCEIKPNY